jgi:type IV pilus assembly protein PilW
MVMEGKQTGLLHAPRKLRGVTLIELMIALVIGSTVVAGALGLYAHGRAIYRVNERIARLQEQGRFALSVIEPDIELAGYYGFTNLPDAVRFVSGASPDTTIAMARELRQDPARAGDALPSPVAGLPAGAHLCGVNFAVDVMTPVQGSNDTFGLGRGRGAACNAYQGRAQLRADTLTIRRVATQSSAAEAGRIQVYAARLASRTAQLLFADGNAPGLVDADHRVHDIVVRTYYVAKDSVGQRNFPALRVKSLTRSGTSVLFAEDEVMPGVEDLQVQFAVDTGDHDNDGAVDAAADSDNDGVPEPSGRATRYVNPDFADLPRVQVVAVRVWLRIRSDEPETGFVDATTYRYANVVYTPTGVERSFRRVLMSRTVALRNARSMQ